MTDTPYLQRWVDLTAQLLTEPADHDPLIEVCAELSERFDGAAVGTMDLGAQRTRLGPYEVGDRPDLDYYGRNLGDHPLIRHYVETSDPRARSLADAARFADDRWSRELIGRARDDG